MKTPTNGSVNLTDRQLHVALAALRVAVVEYQESAERVDPGRVAKHFELQAKKAQDLIDVLEECGIG